MMNKNIQIIVMIKKLLFPFLLLCAFSASAQLNNSWIDYSKTYYKFKIGADNLCRIPQPVFNTAGLGSVNADNFQLWRNGQQIRLYTSISGGPLGAADYVEFWGEMNDGKADKTLYLQPQFQLADRYSLETDTATYFLTVNPAGGNLRYAATVNTSPSAATPDAYFMRSIDVYYKYRLNRGYGKDLGEYVYSGAYDNGEGYTSADLESNTSTSNIYTENITGLNVYAAGPPNSLSIRLQTFANTDNSSRTTTVKLFNTQVFSQTTSNTTDAGGTVANLPLSDLQNTSSVPFTITNVALTPGILDRICFASIGITYPSTFNFNNQKSFYFELAASASGNNIVIDNFNYGATAPVLYDVNNGRRYIGDIVSTPGKVKFVLPASADPVRKFILNNIEPANITAIAGLTQKTFINYNTASTRGDYIIISNQLLYNDGSGANYVDQYRQYRSSANGGGFNAKIYDINELTDQFGFGIKNHPASVRDFVRFMDLQYPVKPKYIMLLGRGVTYLEARDQETNPLLPQLNLVPTFGWPASDILLVAQPGTSVPITPVGRVAAVSGAELGSYLQKVIDYETAQRTPSCVISDKEWMKNAMFIAGGANEIESNLFVGDINQYVAILRDTFTGFKSETFVKTSVATVQQASIQRITELFNEGLGFIGYFGHSSANVFEFNLSNPEMYNNIGKYPFFNVSGCSAGNFYNFDPQRLAGGMSLSEKYTLIPQKGSIGFLADTHFGIPFALHNYNVRLIQDISTLMYGQRVGDQIKEVTVNLGGLSPGLDYYTRIHLEEINLHGDPAIKINSFSKPDYAIDDQSVTITPSIITVADPSFHVKIMIRNIGKAINDSMRVSVKRLLPNATVPVTVLDTLMKATLNTDSLEMNIPINPVLDKGDNKLTVTLDWTNRVDELCETNNTVVRNFTIFEDELRPVFPYNYSIINSPNLTFSASTANPLVSTRNYVMELDTTELFNSTFKKTYTASGPGGVIQFTPTNFTMTDSTVYYWRTAVVPANNIYIWNNSSFVFLPSSSPGYNQSHYFQFTKNAYSNLVLGTDRVLRFTPRTAEYVVHTAIFPYSVETPQYSIVNDGFTEQSGLNNPYATNNNSLRFYIIDSITLKPWYNQVVAGAGQYGSYAPQIINATMRAGYYTFDISTPAARQVVKQFLSIIPSGNVVVLTNAGGDANTHLPAEWATDPGANMYLALKALGFTQLDLVTSHLPYIFAGRKGSSVPIVQTVGASIGSIVDATFDVSGFNLSGQITSDVFGPARKWNSLHWRGINLDPANNDQTAVQVIGLNISGSQDLLATINPAQDTSLTWINAVTYPKLKLKMLNADSITGTPNQLRYWRINADLLPEGAIAPNIRFTMKDTVEAGEPINFSVAFKNISQVKFDSLMKITLKIRTATNYDSIISIPKGKILVAGDTLTALYTIPSQHYPGKNTLYIEFNPDNDQLEEFHFNNFLYKDFYVKSDLFNPLLDVTFDGVHILSRDIVASKPDILIKLKDESRFLALADTALIKVQLRYPDQSLRTFYFNGDTMRFTPANLSAGENAATIDFKPYLPDDGEYELIVSGRDVSGNTAGALNYHTVFTVINKPMISEMLNYPNPFTTSTAFVFTLTGSQVPQNLRIQVLTITGKVVRDITKEELGPIHVGRNITEFKWDGTDMYGQKLANGVYIYRVITNLNGKSLDKYKADGDNTDKFFKKGYGKMYLMR